MAVEPEIWLDGRFVSGADARALAATGYGALTTFLVEGGAVRGLDLHMDRLIHSAKVLFGTEMRAEDLISSISEALTGRQKAWVRVSLFSDEITPRTPDAIVDPRVQITVYAPPKPIADGQRIMTYPHERFMPELKHNATIEVLYARRMARLQGYDDAVLTDREGLLTEGTLWNIGFTKGDAVFWPMGRMLSGVTQSLIAKGLSAKGIVQTGVRITEADLPNFDAAFLCNSSTPCASIASIGGHEFRGNEPMLRQIAECWASHSPQLLRL